MVKSEIMGHDVHPIHVPALRPGVRAPPGRANHAKEHAHLRDAPSSIGITQGYGKAFPATVSFFQGIGTTLMAVGCKYLASTTKSAVELSREAVAKEKAAQEGNAAPESTTNPIANGESVDK